LGGYVGCVPPVRARAGHVIFGVGQHVDVDEHHTRRKKMAYVKVIVINLEGNEFDAEIDPDASPQDIENDLLAGFKLSSSEGYNLRKIPDVIREGSVLVIDKAKPVAARLFSRR
jgi:hypothetical protein